MSEKKVSDWYVYMVQTSKDLLYTGIATDVDRRFQEHCDTYAGVTNAKGAKFFRGHQPVKVVYQEQCENRSDASKRERAIKSLTKSQKLKLID